MRSFNDVSKEWAIWWLDGRTPHNLDVPVIGKFSGQVGVFLANDTLNGKPITVRFTWNANMGCNPRWEQAFSPDNGQNWETNWVMEFVRQ